MSRNATTGIYNRVDNSFSSPVIGTAISPADADTFFDDVESCMNSFIGTSTTSLAIGTGAKTFTTQLTKTFLANTYVHAFSASNPANYMDGTVTSYDPATGALVTSMFGIGGSGTITDWVIFSAGARGAIGATGATGATGPGGATSISGTPTAGQVASFLNSTTIQAATPGTDFVKPNTTSNFTKGFTATSFSVGTKSSGTFSPDPSQGNFQHYTNGGAHTLSVPASVCSMVLECTNASAGALTIASYEVVSGDTYSSAGTKKHIFYITVTNSYRHIHVVYVTGT